MPLERSFVYFFTFSPFNGVIPRKGIRALLAEIPTVNVIGEAASAEEALRLIENHRPDVVLMDISLQGVSGLEATARVVDRFPNTRVIILSMHVSEEYVWQALRSGASGYLMKDVSPDELAHALQVVTHGESYLSSAASTRIAAYIRRVDDTGSPGKLTPRQLEVLELIAKGYTTQQIAKSLQISVKTVETHRTNLMERLDIHDLAGLVRYAIVLGMAKLVALALIGLNLLNEYGVLTEFGW